MMHTRVNIVVVFGHCRAAPGLLLALALCGCAATPVPSAPYHAEAAPAPITASRVESLIGEVAALRGLPQRAAIPVYLLDGAGEATRLRDARPAMTPHGGVVLQLRKRFM